MRGNQGVLHNLSILTAGQVASQLLNVWALVFLADRLGAHWFGVVQIGVTFMAYALITAEWGMLSLGIREVSRLNDPPSILTYARTHMGLMSVQALVVIIGGVVLLPLFPFYSESPLVFLLYLGAVIPQVFMLYWVAVGMERMAWVSLSKIALSLFYALFILLLLAPLEKWTGLKGHHLVPVLYLSAVVGSNLVIGIPLARWFKKVLLPSLPALPEAKRRWSEALPLGANIIVQRVLLNIDIIMLGILTTPAVAGSYAAAMRIVFLLMVVIEVLWSALLPRLSRLAKHDPAEFRRAFNKYLGFVLAGLLPVAVGGFLLGPELMDILYKGKFPAAGGVFQILSIGYTLLAIGTFLGNTLVAEDKQHRYFPPLLLSAFIALTGSFLLIPRLAGIGASLGMAGGHFVLFATLVFLHRHRFSRLLGQTILGLMPALVIMALVVVFTESWIIYPRIALGGLIYLLAILWPMLRFRRLLTTESSAS
jgi:O-antigen/teichoic acid export membrane protein